MSGVYGHESLWVEKQPEKKVWVVSTAKHPRQVLVTIPWREIYRVFSEAQQPLYADYIRALATCQSHPNTALTREEERIARVDFDAMGQTSAPGAPKVPGTTGATEDKKVVSLEEFKRRKQR